MRVIVMLSMLAQTACASIQSDLNRAFAEIANGGPCLDIDPAALAKTDAEAWTKTTEFGPTQAVSCNKSKTPTAFAREYNVSFQKQLGSVCTESVATKVAQEAAWAFQNSDTSFAMENCSASVKNRTIQAYNRAYKDSLGKACSPAVLSQKARQDVTNGENSTRKVAEKCSGASVESYAEAYEKALMIKKLEEKQKEIFALQKEMKKEAKAERLARNIDVRCRIEDDEAVVSVTNNSNEPVELSGEWALEYYNRRWRKVGDDKTYEHIYLSPSDSEEFTDMIIPSDAKRCKARKLG